MKFGILQRSNEKLGSLLITSTHVGDNPNKQQERLANYYVQEEIQLNPACIEKNPGLRTLAKMMLNSMWGKFGQKPNKPK